MSTPNQPASVAFTKRRAVFALVAILLGFSPLLISELALRIVDRGHVSDADDPYVGFLSVRPLFVRNEEKGKYEIARSRLTYFRPDSFSIAKHDREYRVFCLGGSTVQGRPYAIESSFTSWLELSLQAAAPNRKWEVVNCGGVSYASYRLAPIMEEILQYEPDLVVLYTGHNEFLEDRTYDRVKRTPRWIAKTHGLLTKLRTYNSLRFQWLQMRAPKGKPSKLKPTALPQEVEAMLDYRGGLDDYRRDDIWRAGTIEHFEYNLYRMVRMADRAGVPVILVNPVSNLKDSPPFKYEHRKAIEIDDRKRFDKLWNAAKQLDIKVVDRIALLRQAIDIDDEHAGVAYHVGKCYLDRKMLEEARQYLIQAKDEDICPLRIISPMSQVIVRVANSTSASLVDAQELFEQLSEDGMTGKEWLVDHVHPSIQGHQHVAAALLDEMVRHEMVIPEDGWEARRDELYHEQFESLDALYYIRGQQRLEGLRRWTEGRSNLIRSPDSSTPNHDGSDTADIQ